MMDQIKLKHYGWNMKLSTAVYLTSFSGIISSFIIIIMAAEQKISKTMLIIFSVNWFLPLIISSILIWKQRAMDFNGVKSIIKLGCKLSTILDISICYSLHYLVYLKTHPLTLTVTTVMYIFLLYGLTIGFVRTENMKTVVEVYILFNTLLVLVGLICIMCLWSMLLIVEGSTVPLSSHLLFLGTFLLPFLIIFFLPSFYRLGLFIIYYNLIDVNQAFPNAVTGIKILP